jgi:peptide chain release factor subunit 1
MNNKVDKETEKYWLKRLIDEIKKKEGRGTELISLYIPPNRRISDVINYLRQEYSTAANIKSDTTRKNVQNAIQKVIERLKYYTKSPPNGLVIFCGAIPRSGPGTEKMEIYVIEPPEPLNVNLYRCDDHFHTEYLEETLKEKEIFGLISIDINEAAIGYIEGRRLEVVGTYTSGIPGKHRAGGQSARRFERLREMEIHHYFDRIAKHVNDVFLEENVFDRLRGILVGGPGFTKHDFVEEADIDYRLRKKIIGFIDTNYSGKEGLREMINKGSEILKNVRYVYEKKLIDEFMKKLAKNHNMVLYGLSDVMRNIESGAIDRLLVLEDIDYHYVSLKCEKCGNENIDIVKSMELEKLEYNGTRCTECKQGIMFPEDSKYLVDYLFEKSKEYGYKLELISPKTEHGGIIKQFGGLVALLRYPISNYY